MVETRTVSWDRPCAITCLQCADICFAHHRLTDSEHVLLPIILPSHSWQSCTLCRLNRTGWVVVQLKKCDCLNGFPFNFPFSFCIRGWIYWIDLCNFFNTYKNCSKFKFLKLKSFSQSCAAVLWVLILPKECFQRFLSCGLHFSPGLLKLIISHF